MPGRFVAPRRTTLLALAAGIVLLTTPAARAAPPTPLPSDAIADAAERVVESVVNVSSTRTVETGPAAFDPFFNDPRSPFHLDPDRRKAMSAGSGVIVTAGGRVLTNAHVVQHAEQIVVTLADGTELDARVLGIDVPSDLAVLQLEGDLPRLRPLPIGDSSRLRLGQLVLAVGNPFGAGQSVSMGIVSAKGRGGFGLVDYEDFIQTDAAINPGNSGGALVNLDGELVGINTAILSRSGGYQGIGFAIPSNMAAPIMKMLVEDGKVSRGYIGVMLQPLTRAWQREHQVDVKRGVVVHEVVDGGPAAAAGLRARDVIVAADRRPVDSLPQLRNYIAMLGAGAKVELEVVRGGKPRTIAVTTRELPAATERTKPTPREPTPREAPPPQAPRRR